MSGSFTEGGTIRFDDGDGELEIVTVSEGTLSPSAPPDVLHGAVVYRITGGPLLSHHSGDR